VEPKARWRLAIRAVVVTTRSSVRSHRAWGKHHLEREAAERGLELLDDLADRLPDDDELREDHEAARRSLTELRDEAPTGDGTEPEARPTDAPPASAQASPLPTDLTAD
jgi:hypothetical protein